MTTPQDMTIEIWHKNTTPAEPSPRGKTFMIVSNTKGFSRWLTAENASQAEQEVKNILAGEGWSTPEKIGIRTPVTVTRK